MHLTPAVRTISDMRITLEEDPEAIKRYDHVKPARGWGVRLCSAVCSGTPHRCTLAKSHRGPHVAHGRFGKVVAVWHAGVEVQGSRANTRRALEGLAGGSLRGEGRGGFLGALWDRVVRASSVEEIALFVLFLAMVGFAIDWLLMILG